MAPAAPKGNRRFPRMPFKLKTRIYREEGEKKKGTKLDLWARSANMGVEGAFLESTALLKPGTSISLDFLLEAPKTTLTVEAEVIHTVPLDDGKNTPGMGVQFTGLTSKNKELLLRFFVRDEVGKFYPKLIGEFPHLKEHFDLSTISLILNYWDEIRDDLED